MLNNVNAVLQAFAVLLKEVHAPNMTSAIFDQNVFSSMIKKNNAGVTFKNEKIFIPTNTAGHSGVAFTGGYIADGAMQFDQTEATAKYGYGSHILDDKQIENIKTQGEAALINIADKFAEGLNMSFARTTNRMMLGNGDGVVANFTASASATATHTVSETLSLIPGKRYVVGTLAAIKAGTGTVVTLQTINGTPNSVTFTAPVTIVNGDKIVTEGAYIGTACQEYDGIGNLVDNESNASGSSFQGKTRATNYWANSIVGGNGALTEAMVIAFVKNLTKYGKPDLLVTHPDLQLAYAAILQSVRKNNSDVKYMDLETGFKGIEIIYGNTSVPLVSDWDNDKSTIFGLTTDTFSHAELCPLEALEAANGGTWTDVFETVGGVTRRKAAYQTTMKMYGNLVCTNAMSNGKLKGLTY
jgi:hypothetical protein